MTLFRTMLAAALALAVSAAVAQEPTYYTQAATDSLSVPAGSDSALCIVNSINASGHIAVVQPQKLTDRLTRRLTATTAEAASEGSGGTRPEVVATRNGYRVQVFDDNNPGTARSQAESRRVQFENAFPQWRAYVTFNSPYWQVRVGDFRRRGEAEAALAQIRDAMPSVAAYARIVAEKINITE